MSHKVYVIDERAKGKGRMALISCPGCKSEHPFKLDVPSNPGGPVWSFNEDLDKPTFRNSMLVDSGGKEQCHSFVTDGMIQFLGDCFHDLKNTTVELPICSWYQ